MIEKMPEELELMGSDQKGSYIQERVRIKLIIISIDKNHKSSIEDV